MVTLANMDQFSIFFTILSPIPPARRPQQLTKYPLNFASCYLSLIKDTGVSSVSRNESYKHTYPLVRSCSWMVTVLALTVIRPGFKPRSGQ